MRTGRDAYPCRDVTMVSRCVIYAIRAGGHSGPPLREIHQRKPEPEPFESVTSGALCDASKTYKAKKSRITRADTAVRAYTEYLSIEVVGFPVTEFAPTHGFLERPCYGSLLKS